MTSPHIWYFIKFFTEETHADQFIAGNLYMNTLSYFKTLENEGDNGRPDSTEAVAHWWQPDDILVKLQLPGIGETKISKKDLAAPVSISFDYHNYVHIFCYIRFIQVASELVAEKLIAPKIVLKNCSGN